MPGNAAQTLAGWSRSRSLTEVPFAAAQLLIGFRAEFTCPMAAFIRVEAVQLRKKHAHLLFVVKSEAL
jgi:hypothetical protein